LDWHTVLIGKRSKAGLVNKPWPDDAQLTSCCRWFFTGGVQHDVRDDRKRTIVVRTCVEHLAGSQGPFQTSPGMYSAFGTSIAAGFHYGLQTAIGSTTDAL
jgi:hypothetical protein